MAKAPIQAVNPTAGVATTGVAGRTDSDGNVQQTTTLGSDNGTTVADMVEAMDRLIRAINIQVPRGLQYARDAQDRMRVVLGPQESTPSIVIGGGAAAVGYVSTQFGAQGVYSNWYQNGAPTSMDAREQQRELSGHTFQSTRNRWTIT